MKRNLTRVLMVAILGLAGCGDDDRVPAGQQAVALQFAARVGNEPFACDRVYTGIGNGGSTIAPLDFRLYVSNVRLVDDRGREETVQLDQDGAWQVEDLALLDFEDRGGTCLNGTEATNTTVRGRVATGTYRGVRFDLGVPFRLNHQDAATAKSPLNLTTMFWSWNGGYKFVRADVRSDGLAAFNIHLGSTGCSGTPPDPVTSCDRPNRPEITLAGKDPTRNTIVVDLAAVLAGTDVDVNQPMTAPGCMSAPTDSDCTEIFPRLGLSFPDGAEIADGQRLFRFE